MPHVIERRTREWNLLTAIFAFKTIGNHSTFLSSVRRCRKFENNTCACLTSPMHRLVKIRNDGTVTTLNGSFMRRQNVMLPIVIPCGRMDRYNAVLGLPALPYVPFSASQHCASRIGKVITIKKAIEGGLDHDAGLPPRFLELLMIFAEICKYCVYVLYVSIFRGSGDRKSVLLILGDPGDQ